MRNIRYLQAVAEGLTQEMVRDSSVFVMGEDVRHSLRGITKGLVDEFGPDRIIDTPISESGFTGVGTGAAILGMRPVLEYQVSEFVFFAFDQLVDQAQKLRYMSGGKLTIPVTYIIVGSGARGGMAGQHSDNPYPYILHGGIKTVIPSTPYDAKGLLVSAIRDNDPVAVFLPINCMGLRGSVPEEEYVIPLGEGELKKEGNDITVVAVGHLVCRCNIDNIIGNIERVNRSSIYVHKIQILYNFSNIFYIIYHRLSNFIIIVNNIYGSRYGPVNPFFSKFDVISRINCIKLYFGRYLG